MTEVVVALSILIFSQDIETKNQVVCECEVDLSNQEIATFVLCGPRPDFLCKNNAHSNVYLESVKIQFKRQLPVAGCLCLNSIEF